MVRRVRYLAVACVLATTAAWTSDASAQQRRRPVVNHNSQAAAAAIAIGALAVGAAIIASQNRERAQPTYGYDVYGRPLPMAPCRDPYGRPIYDPHCQRHVYQVPDNPGYQAYRPPPPNYYSAEDDYRHAYRPGRVGPVNPYDPHDWRIRPNGYADSPSMP